LSLNCDLIRPLMELSHIPLLMESIWMTIEVLAFNLFLSVELVAYTSIVQPST